MSRKPPTKAERAHMDAVAQLGCITCRNRGLGFSPATIHHCGTYMGGGRDHMRVLPLCPEHHQGESGVDGKKISKREWEEINGTEEILLAQVGRELERQKHLRF